MAKFRIIILLFLIASLQMAAVAQKVSKETLQSSDGKKRTYYIYVPETIKADIHPALVVLLHGSNHNGQSLIDKWKDLAKEEQFIIVGPDSFDSANWAIPGDGPAPLRDLVEELRKKYPIDAKRIYLFGHSGGAVFALFMSLYESEYFAAVAVHAGALDSSADVLLDIPQRKTPIYIQVGTNDPYFPVSSVRATRDALLSRSFPVKVTEIPRHDHWYYDLAPSINRSAWDFLKTNELPAEPRYQEHRFKTDGRGSKEAVAQYNRGMERQNAGDVPGAITAYTRAIELDKKYAEAYNNRGVAYMSQKDYASAVADFTRSIELEPTDAAYNNRGNIYFSQLKTSEAIADFSEAIKLKPSPEAFTNRGTAYQQTKQQSLALADYDSALKLNPNFARAYVLRGLVLLQNGQDEAAWKDLDKGFKLEPALHAEFDALIKQLRPNQ
jgi:poly(3-hydroxybutyrate) depolymerase/regulator of sirC expression with transglutaminase-like and TPR domain